MCTSFNLYLQNLCCHMDVKQGIWGKKEYKWEGSNIQFCNLCQNLNIVLYKAVTQLTLAKHHTRGQIPDSFRFFFSSSV